MFQAPESIQLQKIPHLLCKARNVDLRVLRLDQTDALISGNKWYKLKYNLLTAKEQGFKTVLSFGGAYSNHIHALAWAGKQLGINTVGVIRGEPEYAQNPTLTDARLWGMQLQFVNRQQYRSRHESTMIEAQISQLADALKPVFVIPEGGSNSHALKGCAEILNLPALDSFTPNTITLACGTGGTMAGIATTLETHYPEATLLGIPVLKNAEFLYQDIQQLMTGSGYTDPKNWSLDLQGHYGGYAKCSEEIDQFIDDMNQQFNLPLDHVYTGKMLCRLLALIKKGQFDGQRVLAIHTGGLQGLRSIK